VKVFLSWSGRVSNGVAHILARWLPYMLHSIEPFVSDEDISKGADWKVRLGTELADAKFGIVCVTPFNLSQRWLNFEAGALSAVAAEPGGVAPFLFRVNRAMLGESPLSQFQLSEYSGDNAHSRDEFLKLVHSLNDAAGGMPGGKCLAESVLTANFLHWWDLLRADLEGIPMNSPGETTTSYKWLRTFEDLALYELGSACRVVWFVTSRAYKYEEAARAAIQRNSTVQFRFLIPQSEDNQPGQCEFFNRVKSECPTVDYRCCEPGLFKKEAPTDYVIISTGSVNDLTAFVRIPIVDGGTEYWFDAEKEAAFNFYTRFNDLWEHPSGKSAAAAGQVLLEKAVSHS
jgi:hypothetical protein